MFDVFTMQHRMGTVRRTRSGRAIIEVSPKPTRKSRKKVQVDSSDTENEQAPPREQPEQIEQPENAHFDDIRTEFAENDFKSSEEMKDIENETESTEIKSETIEMITSDMPEDSNSMTNDFNSFKGAESSSDAINNESNSCFEDGFVMSENGNHDMEDNNMEVMEEVAMDEDIQQETEEESKDGAENAAKADPDAENISEDELPTMQAVKVPETEEVSDEELPGPKRAELPADTENVSEEELETVKNNKRKLEGDDNGSPASDEVASKKPSLDKTAEGEQEEKDKAPKKLPELDKYWKAVNDEPADFTGWTYLLQYVDHENDMEAAREAYDAFLSHYPYCYGYWRKYADYEKRKGNKKKCEELFDGCTTNCCYSDIHNTYKVHCMLLKAVHCQVVLYL